MYCFPGFSHETPQKVKRQSRRRLTVKRWVLSSRHTECAWKLNAFFVLQNLCISHEMYKMIHQCNHSTSWASKNSSRRMEDGSLLLNLIQRPQWNGTVSAQSCLHSQTTHMSNTESSICRVLVKLWAELLVHLVNQFFFGEFCSIRSLLPQTIQNLPRKKRTI